MLASSNPLFTRTRRDSGASAHDLKVRKDSVTSVNSGKGFVSKEDKVKTGNKKGIGNKVCFFLFIHFSSLSIKPHYQNLG